VIHPTIHLNGTAPASLLECNEKAQQAIRTAIEATARTAPHGRDYYPQGPGALAIAEVEYRSRMACLHRVLDELSEIRDEIVHQDEARRR